MFPIHNRFPREMAVIGRLLVDYGELELDLMNCVQMGRGGDLNSTLKAMFRVRGETNRIDIADGLARASFERVGLASEFGRMVEQLRNCLQSETGTRTRSGMTPTRVENSAMCL